MTIRLSYQIAPSAQRVLEERGMNICLVRTYIGRFHDAAEA